MGSPAQAVNIDRLNTDPLLTITHRKLQKHVPDHLTSSSHAHRHKYMAAPHPFHRHIGTTTCSKDYMAQFQLQKTTGRTSSSKDMACSHAHK